MIAEDISGNNGYVELSFRARKLDDKVCGGRPCAAVTTAHPRRCPPSEPSGRDGRRDASAVLRERRLEPHGAPGRLLLSRVFPSLALSCVLAARWGFLKSLFTLVAPLNDGDTCWGGCHPDTGGIGSEPGSVGSHTGWKHTQRGSHLLEGLLLPPGLGGQSLGRRRGDSRWC